MRHSAIGASGLRILVLTLAVNGCALRDQGPPADAASGSMGEAWRAPLVLRPGLVVVDMQVPSRAAHGPGLAGEVFWLSVTSLFTFGGPLLDLPNVVARHRTSVPDLPPECEESWAQVTSRPQWLGPSDERRSALEVLAKAMRQDLDRRGQRLTIEIEPTAADDARARDALAGIGMRLSAPALAVADVLFGIEPEPKACAIRMRVSVQMHLEKLGVEAKPAEPVSLTRASAVSVTQWAQDPDVGSRALQGLLGQLGRDIVLALPASPAR